MKLFSDNSKYYILQFLDLFKHFSNFYGHFNLPAQEFYSYFYDWAFK